MFIGDTVVKGQPPFLAHADIPAWLESLEYLMGGDFKGYTIVSGRNGVVAPQAIKGQYDFLKKLLAKIEKLGAKRSTATTVTDKLADQLLKDFKSPAAKHKQYSHRLRFGLRNYYARHYLSSSRHAVDE